LPTIRAIIIQRIVVYSTLSWYFTVDYSALTNDTVNNEQKTAHIVMMRCTFTIKVHVWITASRLVNKNVAYLMYNLLICLVIALC